MIHAWLQKAIIGLLAVVAGIGFMLGYILWLSPKARLGNYNQRQAHLVQPGMPAGQAHRLMGPPQERQLLTATGDTMYSYQAPPLSSDGMITMTVSSAGVVKTIGH